MTTYVIHYIDGDSEVIEAGGHHVENGLYTLKDVTSANGKYVEVDLVIHNAFSVRREYDE